MTKIAFCPARCLYGNSLVHPCLGLEITRVWHGFITTFSTLKVTFNSYLYSYAAREPTLNSKLDFEATRVQTLNCINSAENKRKHCAMLWQTTSYPLLDILVRELPSGYAKITFLSIVARISASRRLKLMSPCERTAMTSQNCGGGWNLLHFVPERTQPAEGSGSGVPQA